ncbi:MAG: phospholipase D-like domain-containing protein [Leptospirales bacterium]
MERFITEGDEFYERALAAIRGARTYISLEMYIFSDDEIGRRFHEALCAAARAGRKTVVIYDRVGCFSTPASFWRELREAGVFVYRYLPGISGRLASGPAFLNLWGRLARVLRALRRGFLRRNHRKTLVVDGQIAFIGGFNLMRECSATLSGRGRWLDTMYVTDRPILVHAIETYFQDSLRRIRGARREMGSDLNAVRKRAREAILYPARAARSLTLLLSRIRRPRKASREGGLPGGPRAREARIDPGYVRMAIPRAFKKLLYHSQRRIWLTYPYFVPYGGILRLLYRKAGASPLLNGGGRPKAATVDVRVYLSMISDLPWMQDITMLIAERLRRRGVPVYLYHGREGPGMSPRFSHAKVALIDDWVGLGASNFDRRSMVLNLESLFLRHRAPFLTEIEAFFAYLEAHSVRLDDSNQTRFRAGWRAYLLYPFRRWI